MSEWTEDQAKEVLAAGDSLVVELPGYAGCELFVERIVDGLYEVRMDEKGFDEPIAMLPWGEFKMVGFNLNMGFGEESEGIADILIAAGAKDERDKPKTVN